MAVNGSRRISPKYLASIQREIGTPSVDWELDAQFAETPELIWPHSVAIYDKMRRSDSQVAAIMRAITLPLRQASFRIEANGASDEVTEFVAHDLGLPIAGQDDKPSPYPRRRDRFQWGEHVRNALLMLPYGHMIFEQVYRVDDDGAAHIRKLAPRMPQSIAEFDIDPEDGGLNGIWQANYRIPVPVGRNYDPRGIFIPIDRLVVYTNEREGANWFGQSVLRAAYWHWLLKVRTMRLRAMTVERASGIPIYTASEHADETEMTLGNAMAQDMRSGEFAGAALPNGASLSYQGMSGSIPDTMADIQMHDEAIARSVLAQFMMLGTTQTGSRALGESFVDFFQMAEQAILDNFAETCTCHVVEDLVDINYGDEEPAPRIVPGDITNTGEAMSGAISQLIQVGAIAPDKDLEQFFRREFHLPAPAPGAPMLPPNAPSAGPQPDATAPYDPEDPNNNLDYSQMDYLYGDVPDDVANPQGTGSSQFGQGPPPFPFGRAPLAHESAARTDFALLDSAFRAALNVLFRRYRPFIHRWVARVGARLGQDDREATTATLSAVEQATGDLLAQADDIERPVAQHLRNYAWRMLTEALAEARRQGVDVPDYGRDRFEAEWGVEIDNLVETTGTLLARLGGWAAKRTEKYESTQLGRSVSDDLTRYVTERAATVLENHLAGLVGGALSIGRFAAMEHARPERLYASELLDARTCGPCAAIDGMEFDSILTARLAYPLGGYVECEGRQRCRGTLVAVYGEHAGGPFEAEDREPALLGQTATTLLERLLKGQVRDPITGRYLKKGFKLIHTPGEWQPTKGYSLGTAGFVFTKRHEGRKVRIRRTMGAELEGTVKMVEAPDSVGRQYVHIDVPEDGLPHYRSIPVEDIIAVNLFDAKAVKRVIEPADFAHVSDFGDWGEDRGLVADMAGIPDTPDNVRILRETAEEVDKAIARHPFLTKGSDALVGVASVWADDAPAELHDPELLKKGPIAVTTRVSATRPGITQVPSREGTFIFIFGKDSRDLNDDENVRKSHEKGNLVPRTTREAIIHELGHAVARSVKPFPDGEHAMTKAVMNAYLPEGVTHEELATMAEDNPDDPALNLTVLIARAVMQDELSHYGASNPLEAWAELYTAYYTGQVHVPARTDDAIARLEKARRQAAFYVGQDVLAAAP